ncbi:MAG: hydrolase [Desulfobacteraceae bacterium]|nr:hydrolase [Desulfobacteraceae bacterium]
MFTIDNSVMLIVDVQGQLAQQMYEKDKLFSSLELIIKGMKILNVPILWMEQIPSKLGPTIEQISCLMEDNTPLEKFSFSCCKEPAFIKKFEALGRNQILLTGIETHICVYQTGYELLNQGCQVQVATDCVSSRTKENKEIGLERLSQSGGQITSVEMIFFELMREARGDKFKQILKLIK